MSEYIEVTQVETEDPLVLILETNVPLAPDGTEVYASAEAMQEGSPLAHALAIIPGIAQLQIDEQDLTITRTPDTDWYSISEDIRLALIDFFL